MGIRLEGALAGSGCLIVERPLNGRPKLSPIPARAQTRALKFSSRCAPIARVAHVAASRLLLALLLINQKASPSKKKKKKRRCARLAGASDFSRRREKAKEERKT